MNIKSRIEAFNRENQPFNIYDFEDGKYGLSLSIDFSNGPFKGYRQEAFNQYAISVGDPVKKGKLYTHGNGHEWQRVFKKVFEEEKELEEIEFDSEAGGFYCRSENLEVLEKLGQRFKTMCGDKEKFTQIVDEALTAAYQDEQYHFNNKTLKYYLNEILNWDIEIVTRNYHFFMDGDQRRKMVRGKNTEVYEKNTDSLVMVVAKNLYNLRTNNVKYDWDNGRVLIKAIKDDDTSLLLEQAEEIQEGHTFVGP